MVVSVVAPLAQGLEIARFAVFGRMIHVRYGENYADNAKRSYVIAIAPCLSAFLWPFETQAVVAKGSRLVPDASSRTPTKFIVGDATELATVSRTVTNAGADRRPVFRVSRLVLGFDRHQNPTITGPSDSANTRQSAATRRMVRRVAFMTAPALFSPLEL